MEEARVVLDQRGISPVEIDRDSGTGSKASPNLAFRGFEEKRVDDRLTGTSEDHAPLTRALVHAFIAYRVVRFEFLGLLKFQAARLVLYVIRNRKRMPSAPPVLDLDTFS